MPDYRTAVPSPSQKAPMRVSLDWTELDIEVVSADGSQIGRPYLLAMVLNGLVVGWRLSFEPPQVPELIVCDSGPQARPSAMEDWLRRLLGDAGASDGSAA